MTAPKRPARLFLLLTVVIVLGLGVAAYLVNLPVIWIVVGEVLTLLGIAWRVSRTKQTQQVTQSGPTT